MRMRLELERISSRGTGGLRDPVVWPVWFAVDDSALRSLAGDPTPTDILHAPGPMRHPSRGPIARWDRTISSSALPPEHTLVGMGLLLTNGGVDSGPVWEAYQDLAALLHGFALAEAARASHFVPLLAAFGGGAVSDPDAHRALLQVLKGGTDPEELGKGVDEGLREGIAAFRGVGQVLAGLVPEPVRAHSPVSDAAAHRAAAVAGVARAGLREVAASLPDAIPPGSTREDVVPGRLPEPPGRPPGFAPGPPPLPGLLPPVGPIRLPDLPDGTVVAQTVQAWRAEDLPSGRPWRIDRTLPALATMRASLALGGSVLRED